MTSVLLVYPGDTIRSNPTVVALVSELARRGIVVDLMTPNSVGLSPGDAQGLASPLRALPMPSLTPSPPTGVRSAIRALREAARQPDVSGYAAIIGVDPVGIAIGARLKARARARLGYLSFELILEDEVEGEYEIMLKTLARAGAQASEVLLIQDQLRRDRLCLDDAVDPARCVLVPVAPVDARPGRSNFLRGRFGIPDGHFVVLYQGSLYDWACANEFEELVSYWRPDEHLVIHTRDRPGKRMRRFLQDLERTGRVHVSDEFLSSADLPQLTASADAGLASYRTQPNHWLTGDNLRLLGLASGKIAYYAMCGLPVLSRSLPSVDANLRRFGFGVSYARLSESGAALAHIRENWAAMSQASRRFYETELNPSGGIAEFCDRLLSSRQGHPA